MRRLRQSLAAFIAFHRLMETHQTHSQRAENKPLRALTENVINGADNQETLKSFQADDSHQSNSNPSGGLDFFSTRLSW